FQQHNYAAADEIALRALDRYPGNGLLWQLHGTARWFMGDGPAARSALEIARALKPLQPLAACALASCYVEAGETEKAREIYVALLGDDRCPPAVLPKVAAGLGRIEEHWLALQVCRKLARREPTHHAAFFGMAFYMARLGYPAQSCLPRLLRAHQLAPD